MNIGINLPNLRRVRHILSVLVLDYGLGSFFDRLGVSGVLPLGRRRHLAPEHARLSGPQRLRLALEELGPTFMKLGQVLSARADLLPADVVAELRRLQDEGPVVPFDELRGRIETDLGRPIERCFREVDPQPLSAASLGQVHAAVLPDGRQVTLKVLRPGAGRLVESDVLILSEAARLLDRQVPSLRVYDLPGFMRRFAEQIQDELIYTLEGHNADRLRQTLKDAGIRAHIPEVIWDLTTRRVLTTERIYGRRVDRLAQATFDRAEAARMLGTSMLHQMFIDGFFHGDPHQGNVLFEEDGAIVMLDFGIMGYLDPRNRSLLAQMVRNVYREDVDGVIDVMSELGTVGGDTDLASLRADLTGLISRFVTLPRRDFPLGELLTRMLRALWLNQVRVSPDLSLAVKAVLMTEAICSELDPAFDFRDLAQPVVEEARAKELTVQAMYDRVARAGSAALHHMSKLPSQIDRMLSLTNQGALRMRVDDPEGNLQIAHLSRSINRLTLALLSASLLVTSAIYLSSARHAAYVGLGIAAIVAGLVVGLIALFHVLRPGRV
jgi:ubiquinone biosynthesis protein